MVRPRLWSWELDLRDHDLDPGLPVWDLDRNCFLLRLFGGGVGSLCLHCSCMFCFRLVGGGCSCLGRSIMSLASRFWIALFTSLQKSHFQFVVRFPSWSNSSDLTSMLIMQWWSFTSCSLSSNMELNFPRRLNGVVVVRCFGLLIMWIQITLGCLSRTASGLFSRRSWWHFSSSKSICLMM